MDDAEKAKLDDFIGRARPLIWADRETHRYLQNNGVQLGPARFYSQIPSIDEIESSFEHKDQFADSGPFCDPRVFKDENVLQFFKETKIHADEFDPPLHGNTGDPEKYFLKNPAFAFYDAVAYWCMIRKYRPSRVVEIGCGFSSLLARDALAKNGEGELICIEPYPMPWLHKRVSEATHVTKSIQDVSVEELNDYLGDNGLLFIDSTHTVKLGSDCLWIYLKLLPNILSDAIVHVHDVVLPFGMSKNKAADKHVHWTEQYILLAYLLENPRIELIFGSFFSLKRFPEETRAFTNSRIPPGGGSIWFTQKARSLDTPE